MHVTAITASHYVSWFSLPKNKVHWPAYGNFTWTSRCIINVWPNWFIFTVRKTVHSCNSWRTCWIRLHKIKGCLGSEKCKNTNECLHTMYVHSKLSSWNTRFTWYARISTKCKLISSSLNRMTLNRIIGLLSLYTQVLVLALLYVSSHYFWIFARFSCWADRSDEIGGQRK